MKRVPKKKSGNELLIAKITLVTAVIGLIAQIIELIIKLLE